MNKRAYKLALGGICLAASVAALVAASVIPGMELTLYAVSSAFVAVMVLEGGLGFGLMGYAGTLALGFTLVPNKLALLPFAVFFGIYPLIKFIGEKPRNPVIQLAVKGMVFLAVLSAAFVGFRELLFGTLNLPDFPWWAIFAAGLIVFYLYDYILTLILDLYRRRIRRSENQIILNKDQKPR